FSGAAENSRYWGLSFPEKEAEARAAPPRAYYRFLDDLLGEILEREGRERTICLFAPVGWGPPPTLEAISLFLRGQRPAASPDAARDGFVLFAGAGVRSGVRLTSASVLDLAPTLLVLAGEPLARDMDGRVLAEVFDERFTESASVPIVSTFEASGPQWTKPGKGRAPPSSSRSGRSASSCAWSRPATGRRDRGSTRSTSSVPRALRPPRASAPPSARRRCSRRTFSSRAGGVITRATSFSCPWRPPTGSPAGAWPPSGSLRSAPASSCSSRRSRSRPTPAAHRRARR